MAKAATIFTWQGKDRHGQARKGEIAATSLSEAKNLLRRQGISANKAARSQERAAQSQLRTAKFDRFLPLPSKRCGAESCAVCGAIPAQAALRRRRHGTLLKGDRLCSCDP